MEEIKKRMAVLEKEIAEHSPKPEKVKTIAVSKYSTVEEMKPYLEAGLRVLGENRVQVIEAKVAALAEEDYAKDLEWHFIGNLQKNKVKYIIDKVAMIHSVNKLSLAKEINKRAKAIGRIMPVLLEINVSGEESKEGYLVEDAIADIPSLLALENISIQGLMTMAPFTEKEEEQREVFKKLRGLQEEWNREYFQGSLVELSMGMSNDYKVALEEGASYIRLGRKIFC